MKKIAILSSLLIFGVLGILFLQGSTVVKSVRTLNKRNLAREVKALDRISYVRRVHPAASGREFVINISRQSDMAGLGSAISGAINKGEKNIVVKFAKGNYQFKHRAVQIIDKNIPDVCLSFIGNGAVLSGEGFNDESIKPLTSMKNIGAKVEIVDASKKMCRIRYSGALSKEAQSALKKGELQILLTEWYHTSYGKVEKVSGGWLYFTTDLGKSMGDYNVNSDYSFGKVTPRFQLWRRADDKAASTFLYMRNVTMKSMHVSGLDFSGSGDSRFIFELVRCGANDILFEKNTFTRLRWRAIHLEASRNVTISDNVFSGNVRDLIWSDGATEGTWIEGNTFDGSAMPSSNYPFIYAYGKEYYIGHNVFRDFPYTSMYLGRHFGGEKNFVSSGIVEHNEIYYTPQYLADYQSHTLMDSGALYVTTQNDLLIIRDNYIHDYKGIKGNNGIFLDDGSFNVKIYRNKVTGISNGTSIHSRRVKDLETRSDSKAKKTNFNNSILLNTVDGDILFEGREDGTCLYGGNIKVK